MRERARTVAAVILSSLVYQQSIKLPSWMYKAIVGSFVWIYMNVLYVYNIYLYVYIWQREKILRRRQDNKPQKWPWRDGVLVTASVKRQRGRLLLKLFWWYLYGRLYIKWCWRKQNARAEISPATSEMPIKYVHDTLKFRAILSGHRCFYSVFYLLSIEITTSGCKFLRSLEFNHFIWIDIWHFYWMNFFSYSKWMKKFKEYFYLVKYINFN